MAKNGMKTDAPPKEAEPSVKGGEGWFSRNRTSIIAVGLIALMAFVMRFVFAYGVSADSAFALSGGTAASEHLHTITQILNGGSFFGSDGSLNYPFGSTNANPVFIDAILAAIAMIGTSLGMAATKAASLTLGTFAVSCGTAAVIAMFFLGREACGTKKAGYLAALFLAFCPIVISQTVFSNGTEVGWYLLLFTLFAIFVFHGVKAISPTDAGEPLKEAIGKNRSAMKCAVIAGIVLALIALSTNAFRPVFVIIIAAMAVMALIDRFRYKDSRVQTCFFSTILVIGIVAAAAYYIPAGLWEEVLSGVLIATLISVAVCLGFSFLQNRPWIVTVPAFLIGIAVFFIVFSFVSPALFNATVSGNSVYAASIGGLVGSSASISMMSIYFGYITMWTGFLVAAVMLIRIRKNIHSRLYVFALVSIVMSIYFSTKSAEMAAVFSPVYALGFAVCILWLFDHVDFKTYFISIRNSDLRTVWRKIIKPVPFLTVLALAFLICLPNAMTAIDAGISNNDADEYKGLNLGAIGYYVKTGDDWTTNPVLGTYSNTQKSGAMVTWMDYSNDAAAFGNFSVIADSKGNGAEAVTNILLSSGIDGSSTASMLIYLLTYTGMTDDVRTALSAAGMSAADMDELSKVITSPGDYRSKVVGKVDRYGALDTSVSDVNIMYIYGRTLLTDNYDQYTISSMYDAMTDLTGKSISYFMVNGSMFPIYYGYSTTFSTMAYVNGYALTDDYGTVGEFLDVNFYTQYYTGMYAYKDAMYDTLLWRAYVGMSPAEAGFTGMLASYNYLTELMLSDGTYKAQPGYGLSNYVLDEGHWYVMYNADSDATLNSDGWQKMLYKDAISVQESKGGLINYLSGLPAVLKYEPNSSGTMITGTVTSAGAGVSGVRVSEVTADGMVRSTAVTAADGTFRLLVTDSGSTIRYYAGSENLADGSLIKTVRADSSDFNAEIAATSVKGRLVDSNGEEITGLDTAKVKMTGKTSGETYSPTVAELAAGVTVIPDIYTVSVVSDDGRTTYAEDSTYTVYMGDNVNLSIEVSVSKVTVTVKDESGAAIGSGLVIVLTETKTGTTYSGTTDVSGRAEISVVNGTYAYSFPYGLYGNGYITDSAAFEVTAVTTKNITVYEACEVTVTGMPANRMAVIYSSGYQTSGVADASGEIKIDLPYGMGAGVGYTVYAYDGTDVYTAKVDLENGTLSKSVAATHTSAVKVTGTLSTAKSGTVLFIDSAGLQIPVSVGSDGSYTAYLAAGDYNVYAVSDSGVHYGEVSVTAEMVHDIAISPATLLSGRTYWSSSYNMSLVPVTVGAIEGFSGSVVFSSDLTGQYSFYIPSGKTCTVRADLKDSGRFDYDSEYYKEYTDRTTAPTFTAKAGDVTITNNAAYTVKVSSEEIASGGSTTKAPTSTSWSVTIDYDAGGKHYYYSGTIASSPLRDLTITDDTFSPVEYYLLTINGMSDGDTVSISADDSGVYRSKTTTGSTREYYIQADKSFSITLKDSESTKVRYKQVEAAGDVTFDASLTESVKVQGYIGVVKSGTLTVTMGTDTFDFTVNSSGRYDITVPKTDMTFAVLAESDGVRYTGSLDVTGSSLATDSVNIRNMAVTGGDTEDSTDVTATAAITEMTSGTMAEVSFTVSVTNSVDEAMTLVPAGGSAWKDLVFYSDTAMTMQISTVNIAASGSATFYGKGTVDVQKTGAGSTDLSISLADINGDERGKAVFSDTDANWKKTTAASGTTVVNIGADSVGDSEYKYAVEIVNKDDYTKTFSFAPEGISTEGWFVTYMFGNTITDDGTAIKVEGNTTQLVYVKITSKTGSQDLPTGIVTIVQISTGEPITTETSEKVSISSNKASVVSTTGSSTVTVKEASASGRNVLNSRSDMPVYVWLMVVLIIFFTFLILWVSSRRGVFSRKK